MTRSFIVKDCSACPHQDHRGGFGSPAYVPVCGASDGRPSLGFTAYPNRNGTGTVAVYDGVIPDWCPLPETAATEAAA